MNSAPNRSPLSRGERFLRLSREQRIGVLRQLVAAGRTAEIPAVIPPLDEDTPERLSPAQEDLWVYETLYPGASLNLSVAYHFHEPVQVSLLERALTWLQERHEVLRLRITGEAGDLRVDFPERGPFRLERVDVADDEAARRVTEEFSRRPFRLDSDQLIRGCHLPLDEQRSVLCLTLHHIVTDWWSFDVLHRDLVRAYQSLRNGVPPDADPPLVRYASFAGWQRELEASGVFGAQLTFWQRHLDGVRGPLAVRGTGAAQRGGPDSIAQVPIRLPADIAPAVRACAASQGVSVYSVLATAFAVLAHRLTGEPDLLIGTPLANRTARGLRDVVGYVMNVVPTRWRFESTDTFTRLVKDFAAEFPSLMVNADVPVGRIVAAVDPPRTPGVSPLFQWVFMYLPRRQGDVDLHTISEPRRIHTGGEYDLVCIVRESEQGDLEGTFEIRTDACDPATAASWAESFAVLLAGLVSSPEAPVSRGALVSEPLDVELAEPEPAPSLSDSVARWATQRPDAVALEAADEAWTYARLHAEVDSATARLRAAGVRPHDVVALALPRSAELAVMALATDRIGAAYLPVDPALPPGRRDVLLAATTPAVLVTLEDGPGAVATPRLTALAGEAALPRVAYVRHTASGDRPATVPITRHALGVFAADLTERLALTGDDRVAQLSAPNCDHLVAGMCLAFTAGAALVVGPADTATGTEIGAFLDDRRISALLTTPTSLATVPAAGHPTLRVICVGGDVCPPDLVRTWVAGDVPRRLHNAYGSTETTIVATVTDPLTPGTGRVPIGRPTRGTRTYVLDADLCPLPLGVPGELYVGGVGVSPGYLRRPGGTTDRFVPDPFAGTPEAHMYRTGDLVRRRPDGQLDYLGRVDDQIVLDGHRIEPERIEEVLTAQPGVTRALAVCRDDAPQRPALVAYVLPQAGATVEPDRLIAACQAALPRHLVPGAVTVLDALPLTPSGKVDRAALPAPDLASSRPPAVDTPDVELFRRLFAELLDCAEVGPEDNFFASGGDSIRAILLVGRARAAGRRITVRQLYTWQTPVALSQVATELDDSLPVATDAPEGALPPPPIVQWWHEIGGDISAFTVSLRLSIEAGVAHDDLLAAVNALVEAHPAARLRLVETAGPDWHLRILPVAETPPPTVDEWDGTDQPPELIDQAVHRIATGTRLDPTAGRMLAATRIVTGGDTDVLVLVAHHLAVDGASVQLLRDDLLDRLRGQAPPDSQGQTSYREWALMLRRRSGTIGAEVERWRSVLRAPGTRLSDRPASGPRRMVNVQLPAGPTGSLLGPVLARYGCGPYDILMTALVAAAVSWRGAGSGLLVDLEGHGREAPIPGVDVSRTLGWFTTVFPALIDPGPAAVEAFWTAPGGIAPMVRAVTAQLHDIPLNGLDFGLLRYANADTAAALAAEPAADVALNYYGRFRATGEDDTEMLGLVDVDAIPIQHALEVGVVAAMDDRGLRLLTTLAYPADTLSESEVTEFARRWSAALDRIASAGGEEGS
ncbi:AMP-binding protein [Micromonospora sp. H61]|uniref:condensation domain-containing protein n=1 Tax=Micromonospora sp. H61 TaxID=2824888 RepID=UPI001B39A386|nr:condensation domain-containing protein [Micromonospora sp. H61]MBQ0988745.1 AMP-binding protein [Micromonospora sp. H61]